MDGMMEDRKLLEMARDAIAEAHDASLDDQHRDCRAILKTTLAALDARLAQEESDEIERLRAECEGLRRGRIRAGGRMLPVARPSGEAEIVRLSSGTDCATLR